MSDAPPPPRPGRRGPIAIAVGVVLVLLLAVASWWWLDTRAERRAATEAANAEVRQEIEARYDALATTTRTGSEAAASLRQTLQEHLTESERTDEQLATDRQNQQAALTDAGRQLQQLGTASPPDLPESASERALAAELDQLAEDQRAAADLGGRFVALSEDAETWASTLNGLRAQAQRYVEAVEGQPSTSDPGTLRAQWEQELALLGEYKAAADAAAQVPGLDPIATAYLTYIDHNTAFAAEAVALLEQGDLDAYNARLDEVFGVEDPFGFQAAVAESTERSLGQGVLADLAAARQEADQVASELEITAEELRPDPEPSTS